MFSWYFSLKCDVFSNQTADRGGVGRIESGGVQSVHAVQLVELLIALSNTWQSDQQARRDENETEDEHERDQYAVECGEVRSV